MDTKSVACIFKRKTSQANGRTERQEDPRKKIESGCQEERQDRQTRTISPNIKETTQEVIERFGKAIRKLAER